MSGSEANDDASAQTQPQIGSSNMTNTHQSSSDVTPIKAPSRESTPTFQAIYTGFDDDVEVEIVERVPANESKHQFGHAIIDRPDWDEPKKALLQNVRVDVTDSEEDTSLEEETDG